eukprot:IDg18428t1
MSSGWVSRLHTLDRMLTNSVCASSFEPRLSGKPPFKSHQVIFVLCISCYVLAMFTQCGKKRPFSTSAVWRASCRCPGNQSSECETVLVEFRHLQSSA